MNSYERKRRIFKIIVLVLGILSINNIILTIGNYSYAYFEKNVKTGVKLKITTLDKMPSKDLKDNVLNKAKEQQSCNPIIEDDNGTPSDPSDDTIYFSGDNDCVNFNYVWYSGKLWRIVAINPDGSMKLVTQDEITAIFWGADTTYKKSWIYQWLNEDFKDTLYNYENIIVQDASWNATADDNSTPVRPKTDSTGTIVTGDVGLLNAYEYYQSGKNARYYYKSYLNIGHFLWLITPYSGSSVRSVTYSGFLSSDSPSSNAYGVRPSINLKSNIGIVSGGDGSETNPYRISGDKEPGNSGEFVNTRISGEYVEVDNKKYRIVGIDKDENGNNITKLTSVDYVRDGDMVLRKNFGSNTSWATSVESGSDDYWGHYLNNTNNETFEGTWLTEELNNYITRGTYYLGQVGQNVSYKNSICSASNTTDPTSTCTKTSSTWKKGLVGLPRVGEMFSAQLGSGYSSSSGSTSTSNMCLITPNGSNVWLVGATGFLGFDSPSSYAIGVRPSIYLKSEVKIISGDGMSESTAYEIGL